MSVWREYRICTLKVFVPNEGGASETLARLLGGLRDTVLCETTRTLALHKVSNIQIGPTGPRPPRPDAGGGGAPGGSKGPSNTPPRVVAILGFHDTDGMVEVINKLIVLPRRSAPHKSNAKKGKGKDTVFTTMQLNIGAGCHCTMMWMEEASTGSHGGLTSYLYEDRAVIPVEYSRNIHTPSDRSKVHYSSHVGIRSIFAAGSESSEQESRLQTVEGKDLPPTERLVSNANFGTAAIMDEVFNPQPRKSSVSTLVLHLYIVAASSGADAATGVTPYVMEGDLIDHPSIASITNVLHLTQEDAAGLHADHQGRVIMKPPGCRGVLLANASFEDDWLILWLERADLQTSRGLGLPQLLNGSTDGYWAVILVAPYNSPVPAFLSWVRGIAHIVCPIPSESDEPFNPNQRCAAMLIRTFDTPMNYECVLRHVRVAAPPREGRLWRRGDFAVSADRSRYAIHPPDASTSYTCRELHTGADAPLRFPCTRGYRDGCP